MFNKRNIKSIYLRVLRKIKSFFTSERSKQLFIFLFFFFVASGFWLLRTLNESYETTLTIPVRLKNTPADVVLTVDPPSKFKVRVRDRGTVLLNYKIGKSFYPVSVDFPSFATENSSNTVKVATTEFQQSILNQLASTTQLLDISPDTIGYVYSHGERKKVPIALQGKIKSNPQYYFADTLINPDSVLVYAPKKILDTISAAYSEPLELLNIKDSTEYKVALLDIAGAKFIPDNVSASFLVDLYIEKTVTVPLVGIGFPEDKILRTFPTRVNVTFQLGQKKYQTINASDFSIIIPYGELLQLESHEKYVLKVHTIPEGIQNVRISPANVDFIIEKITVDDSEKEN
ncbi:MAG: YbbR-like domain-containing protein [Bacteroidales bacterium]|nr:YbbR-like domain-containing protein [Bacteroidales bacterium]